MAKDIVPQNGSSIPLAAALTAAVQKVEAVQVKSARDEATKKQRILLIGPPKHGKTSASFTLSKFAPDSWPAKELADLSDGFVIMLDVGGHDTVLKLNVDVPMVDLTNHQDLNSLKAGFKSAIQILKQRVADGITTWAVVDSISEYGDRAARSLSAVHGSGQDLWVPYGNELGNMFADINSVPIDVALVCHVKDKGDDKKGKRWAAALPGQATIEIDLMGRAAGYARRNTSMILPVVKKQDGKNAVPEYSIYPNGFNGIEGSNRYGLPDKMPPNLRLVLEHIRSTHKK